jgi:hypothetical protein
MNWHAFTYGHRNGAAQSSGNQQIEFVASQSLPKVQKPQIYPVHATPLAAAIPLM